MGSYGLHGLLESHGVSLDWSCRKNPRCQGPRKSKKLLFAKDLAIQVRSINSHTMRPSAVAIRDPWANGSPWGWVPLGSQGVGVSYDKQVNLWPQGPQKTTLLQLSPNFSLSSQSSLGTTFLILWPGIFFK